MIKDEKDRFDALDTLGFNLNIDITEEIKKFQDGTEISVVFDNSSKYTHISLYKKDPITKSKTMFVSYTPANGFSGTLELFKFKVEKQDDDAKIVPSVKNKIKTKMGIEVNLSFNPSLKWSWQREKESKKNE